MYLRCTDVYGWVHVQNELQRRPLLHRQRILRITQMLERLHLYDAAGSPILERISFSLPCAHFSFFLPDLRPAKQLWLQGLFAKPLRKKKKLRYRRGKHLSS